MKSLFRLIRAGNLVLLTLSLLIGEWVWYPQGLLKLQTYLLVFSITCAMAAGNVINDFFDAASDEINKPQKNSVGINFSRVLTFRMYSFLSFLSILLAWFVSSEFAYVVCFCLMLLYAYSAWIKKFGIWGNLSVALLNALPLLCIYYFQIQKTEIIAYASFAFLTNFIREMIKDAEDVEGDKIRNVKSIYSSIGYKNFIRLTYTLIILLNVLIIYLMLFKLTELNLYNLNLAIAFYLMMLLFPFRKLIKYYAIDDCKLKYTLMSKQMKIIMIIGVLSMVIWKL